MPAMTSGGYIKSSVIFRPDQLARLERIAAERGFSKSVIVREAVDEKLDRMERGGPLIETAAVA